MRSWRCRSSPSSGRQHPAGVGGGERGGTCCTFRGGRAAWWRGGATSSMRSAPGRDGTAPTLLVTVTTVGACVHAGALWKVVGGGVAHSHTLALRRSQSTPPLHTAPAHGPSPHRAANAAEGQAVPPHCWPGLSCCCCCCGAAGWASRSRRNGRQDRAAGVAARRMACDAGGRVAGVRRLCYTLPAACAWRSSYGVVLLLPEMKCTQFVGASARGRALGGGEAAWRLLMTAHDVMPRQRDLDGPLACLHGRSPHPRMYKHQQTTKLVARMHGRGMRVASRWGPLHICQQHRRS